MRRPIEAADEASVVRLLESLRGETLLVDVEAGVSRRVRSLPIPRTVAPRVSWRQFSLCTALATIVFALGALGLVATVGPASSGPIAAVAGAVFAAGRSAARGLASRALELAAHASTATSYFEGAIVAAGQLTFFAFIAMLTLALLIVSREALGRRIPG